MSFYFPKTRKIEYKIVDNLHLSEYLCDCIDYTNLNTNVNLNLIKEYLPKSIYTSYFCDYLINELIVLITEYLPKFCQIHSNSYLCNHCIYCIPKNKKKDEVFIDIEYITTGTMNVHLSSNHQNSGSRSSSKKSVYLEATCDHDIELFEYWKSYSSARYEDDYIILNEKQIIKNIDDYASFMKITYYQDDLDNLHFSREIARKQIKQFLPGCKLKYTRIKNKSQYITLSNKKIEKLK